MQNFSKEYNDNYSCFQILYSCLGSEKLATYCSVSPRKTAGKLYRPCPLLFLSSLFLSQPCQISQLSIYSLLFRVLLPPEKAEFLEILKILASPTCLQPPNHLVPLITLP